MTCSGQIFQLGTLVDTHRGAQRDQGTAFNQPHIVTDQSAHQFFCLLTLWFHQDKFLVLKRLFGSHEA
ncbi:hypothetical protein GCM10010525_05200 [Glutamicibacter bergerei]|uniref:Uncharacterized protein n=1 Tax=Glutamicibacter ardleyensis TaxID=225894 RepID=A0ABQ2DMP5_9MICC|nr:hypothetical protein GCM10007173_18430 [Glutamicibacter ardleyensis]